MSLVGRYGLGIQTGQFDPAMLQRVQPRKTGILLTEPRYRITKEASMGYMFPP